MALLLEGFGDRDFGIEGRLRDLGIDAQPGLEQYAQGLRLPGRQVGIEMQATDAIDLQTAQHLHRRRIAAAVRRPIAIGGDQITVGVSIGLALADSAGETAVQLLHRADRAVYAAKGSDSGIAVSTGPQPSARPSPPARVDTDG